MSLDLVAIIKVYSFGLLEICSGLLDVLVGCDVLGTVFNEVFVMLVRSRALVGD